MQRRRPGRRSRNAGAEAMEHATDDQTGNEVSTRVREGGESPDGVSGAATAVAPQDGRAEASRRRGSRGPSRRALIISAVALATLGVAAYFVYPYVVTALNTVSTDDAYVNGHVTQVAPRVDGQVVRVLVDDNIRVAK